MTEDVSIERLQKELEHQHHIKVMLLIKAWASNTQPDADRMLLEATCTTVTSNGFANCRQVV